MDFSTQDAYEQFLDSTLSTWTAAQHAMLAAAMAERWIPQYEAFSETQEWGNAPALRQVLNTTWELLQSREQASGKLPTTKAIDESVQMVRANTPHMDDFDAPAALAVCVMIEEALQCSKTDNNLESAIQALLSGFEAVAPQWELEEPAESRRWRKSIVQRELKKQLKLIELIATIDHFDDATIQALRKTLSSKSLLGEIAPPNKANVASPGKDASGRTFISNQTAFEQYRRMLEADLKNSDDWWQKEYTPGSTMWAMMIVAAWSSRYSRRRQTIDGTYGPLSDTKAQQALVARQRARDAAQTVVPHWPADLLEMLEMMLQNSSGGIDVTSLDAPHRYGPSLRSLWAEAQQRGLSDIEAWNHILAWARHRPAAWQEADRNKKQKYGNPLLDHFSLALVWQPTGDTEYPWASDFGSASYRIRLNDFPDAFMYTLLINNAAIGDFNDWPESWHRGS